eukprot:CAMPEP_0181034278 /NCGR_PEP_ID=MMETSP1070-20121207/7726_1 /TAXON_ID=265543 /ORGANISM="Minutocellus polymorphus, Strain NH13" /LENGTH=82 /DNA_ID=CAMNT_0023111803 /DNA_START=409 /DNA_END=653 /DNA_ORIENTATION=+
MTDSPAASSSFDCMSIRLSVVSALLFATAIHVPTCVTAQPSTTVVAQCPPVTAATSPQRTLLTDLDDTTSSTSITLTLPLTS